MKHLTIGVEHHKNGETKTGRIAQSVHQRSRVVGSGCADRLDFLPRGHDRAGIFLYPVYVCAAQRSRFDGTLHEPETLDVSGGGAAGMWSGAVVLDEMERARAGAGWIGDGHKLDRLHGDPVVFHFAARQQYIQSIYLFPLLKAV